MLFMASRGANGKARNDAWGVITRVAGRLGLAAIHAQGGHAVDPVTAAGDARRRGPPGGEAAILGGVLDRGPDVERMVHAPALGSPFRLGDEEGDHQGLEHRPIPARHDPETSVGPIPLVDRDSLILADLAPAGRHPAVAVGRSGPRHPE